MKKQFFMILLIIGLRLYALQWPLPESIVLTSFLQDSFLMELGSNSDKNEIKPVLEGEILFYYTQDDWNTLALGERSLLVLEHRNQYRTVYSMDRIHGPVLQRQMLNSSDVIGEMEQNTLGLGVWDMRSGGWMNPQLLLPGQLDNKGVILHQARLVRGSESITLSADNRLALGNYELQIKAQDLISGSETIPLLPYRVECRYLGDSEGDLEFSGALYENNLFQLMEGKQQVVNLFSNDRQWIRISDIYVGPGRADLEVTLWDFAGNSRSYIFIIRS